jgi:probable phosphoglycerate mutase
MLNLPHTLVLVRHGETDWNVERRMQGRTDIPLNERGRAQAWRHGVTLARKVPGVEQFDFASSPLVRARETMEIMRAAMGLDPHDYRIAPELMEITFGTWEGFTLGELAITGPEEVKAREADKWGYVPPEGESYAMATERVRRFAEAITRDTVAVSHGAVGRCLRGLLFGTDTVEVPVLEAPQDTFLICREGAGEWH